FEIGPPARRGLRSFEVVQERCVLHLKNKTTLRFEVAAGHVQEEGRAFPIADIEADRLYLPVASAQHTYAPLFAGLRGMRFYNFDLDALRRPQPQAMGSDLGGRGEHLGDVLA